MGNVSMEASQINYRGGETKMSVEQALKETSGEAAAIAQLQTDVGNLQTTKANQITIAPFFSAETAYDPGDLVYYNGLTYRCVNAHEGEWDADDFAATTISNELDALKSGLMGDVVNITTGVTLYRQGKFRMLVVFGASATEGGIIATLPVGDRPSSQFNYPSLHVESDTMKNGYLQIFDNGNVYIRAMDDVLKNNCPAYGSYCYHII